MIDSLKRLGDNVLSTRTIRVVAIAVLLSTGIVTSGLVSVTNASAATPKLVVTPSTGGYSLITTDGNSHTFDPPAAPDPNLSTTVPQAPGLGAEPDEDAVLRWKVES